MMLLYNMNKINSRWLLWELRVDWPKNMIKIYYEKVKIYYEKFPVKMCEIFKNNSS